MIGEAWRNQTEEKRPGLVPVPHILMERVDHEHEKDKKAGTRLHSVGRVFDPGNRTPIIVDGLFHF